MRWSAVFGLLLNTVVKVSRRENFILQNVLQRMSKWLLNQNCQQKLLLFKIWEHGTDVHLRIVKLESGDQQLPVIKKNLSANSFKIEKSFFSLEVLKTYVFTQIT